MIAFMFINSASKDGVWTSHKWYFKYESLIITSIFFRPVRSNFKMWLGLLNVKSQDLFFTNLFYVNSVTSEHAPTIYFTQ